MLTEPPLILDTDLLSSYAWVKRLDILERLYSGQMIILDEVMEELYRVSHLAASVQSCISNGSIRTLSLNAASPEALDLAIYSETGIYGRGESACMAYLNHNPGTMGSNNLADIKRFCLDNDKQLVTTGDTLYQALNSKLITLDEGNRIWSQMLDKKRKLPTSSFSEFITIYC